MSDPFIGELRLLSFNYAPKGWMPCDGSLLPINQNQALFSLLGTAYGGDGRTTFGLPNLQNRIAVHNDQAQYIAGQVGGEAAHTLTSQEMPVPHTHAAQGTSNAATSTSASGNVLANATANMYAKSPSQPIAPGSLNQVGGAPHENMSPYLTVMCCIALVGIFPSRN
jgi:microcystin-dependent protein